MLKSYEAIYDRGQLHWVHDKPDIEKAQVIVTVIDLQAPAKKTLQEVRRLLNETRGAWGKGKSLDDVDREIAAMRAEWQREWDTPDEKPDA
jgi:hypothetical protein